jgi:hypothetical protein
MASAILLAPEPTAPGVQVSPECETPSDDRVTPAPQWGYDEFAPGWDEFTEARERFFAWVRS